MSRGSITVTPLGAAGEVTGSAYHVRGPESNILVDFGLFQGGREQEEKNRVPERLAPRKLDAIVLTHGHLDHTGRLPLLPATGFTGPVYCTPATIEMTALILRDAQRLHQQDTDRTNKKLRRAGRPPIPPLYTADDVEKVLTQLKPVPYNEPVEVARGITARYYEAGHMLGSASVQLTIADGQGGAKTVAFSGDVGPIGAPQLKDFQTPPASDLVFLESTYGDRNHRPFAETVEEFVEIIKATAGRGGKVLIPTFAVGRAQVLTLLLGWMFRKKLVPRFPVFLDSPMAIQAWEIWQRHQELLDAETLQFLRSGNLDQDLASLQPTSTADESKAINHYTGPCLVMAGAGMCTGGRILHHFRNHLWQPTTSVIIVGFQAKGSLGRRLVDREDHVTIFGEEIAVKAGVHTLNGFSAHAGQADLMRWVAGVIGAGNGRGAAGTSSARPKLVLTHGEEHGRKPLARKLHAAHGVECVLPMLGQVVAVD